MSPTLRWRVGGKLKRTLYRDDQLVGLVDTGEIAAEIVEALNGRERYVEGGPEVDEQLAKLDWYCRRVNEAHLEHWWGTGHERHCPGIKESDLAMAPESGRERSPEVITYTEHDRIEEQLRKRSPEPFVAVRAEVCGACLSREDVGADGRFEAHVNSSGQPCSGSRRVAP